MKRAIISDVHGNSVALRAVLADIEKHKVDSIYCLGDVIGYGPDPRTCLTLSREFDLHLMGNHEEAVLFEPIGFNSRARVAIEWTKEQLTLDTCTREENRQMWDFVGSMLEKHVEDGVLYVHASPREPIREYIFVSDIRNQEKMDEIFSALDQNLCFNGHTHTAGVFTEDYQFIPPGSVDYRFKLGSKRAIINVGSVGQPRDGDPRASYVIFDGETVEFHRVQYDIEATIKMFRDNPTLPEYLALRLIEGR